MAEATISIVVALICAVGFFSYQVGLLVGHKEGEIHAKEKPKEEDNKGHVTLNVYKNLPKTELKKLSQICATLHLTKTDENANS